MAKLENSASSIFEQTMIACRGIKTESVNPVKESSMISHRVKTAKAVNESEDNDRDPLQPDTTGDESTDGVSKDIVVVTDPDLSTADYDDTVSNLKDLVDKTPGDKVPEDTKYVGKEIYECPVCANKFFHDGELKDGSECPVCGETVDRFIYVGKVDKTSEEDNSEGETPESTEEPSETSEESTEDSEDLKPSVPSDTESSHRVHFNRSSLSLDEKTLNPFLNKFIKENYSNAESMNVVAAKRYGSNLVIECRIKFKSGKTQSTSLTFENFNPTNKMIMRGSFDNYFKAESSKVPPITLEASVRGHVLSVSGMKYSFITAKEGKRFQIYGKYIAE
jgi:uncharacterized Zn finger protein (UPF0148 family)